MQWECVIKIDSMELVQELCAGIEEEIVYYGRVILMGETGSGSLRIGIAGQGDIGRTRKCHELCIIELLPRRFLLLIIKELVRD